MKPASETATLKAVYPIRKIHQRALGVALIWGGFALGSPDPGRPQELTRDASSEEAESVDEIRFQVTGLRSDKGHLVCGLFTGKNWLRQGSPGEDGKIAERVATCVFRDITRGTYGISSYHDENGNGKLDSNAFHIPREGTAASNGARSTLGPPKFEDAKFVYDGGLLELESSMQYW